MLFCEFCVFNERKDRWFLQLHFSRIFTMTYWEFQNIIIRECIYSGEDFWFLQVRLSFLSFIFMWFASSRLCEMNSVAQPMIKRFRDLYRKIKKSRNFGVTVFWWDPGFCEIYSTHLFAKSKIQNTRFSCDKKSQFKTKIPMIARSNVLIGPYMMNILIDNYLTSCWRSKRPFQNILMEM